MHDATPGLNASSSDALKSRLAGLLDELIRHDGFGSLSVEVRLLKRGQKEVIIDCGKQYRYVIDFAAG
ncbi:MAG: hypothetical protein JNK71_12235 [Methyloversatilis sp.]|jgi:hypothetical protein|uniref:hypothetical protein n=1 Tax=Methyloversatilis sp. TaxID=2569862 RepID=UPI001A613C00|nr:hypothetical protein [Methyloversatilis sp.]MBL8476822.1 hypothetical protein [Methyloversatilis sp.]